MKKSNFFCLSGPRTAATACVVMFGLLVAFAATSCVAWQPLDEEGKVEKSPLQFDDCNDNDLTTWAAAPESCDGKDNNCNGQVDEGMGPECCQADADCADANLCNGAETCVAHQCQDGTPLSCDDSDACTTDSCDDPASGACGHVPVGCDDGNLCTTDSCDAATGCVNAAVDCDDGDACTTDSCDAANGSCGHVPVGCDDGDMCNGAETCVAGACAAGSPLDCDDGDVCTTDSCDAVTGCGHAAVAGCCHFDQGAVGDAECVASKPANLASTYLWGCFPGDKCSACEDLDGDGHCAQNSPGGLGEQVCTDGYDGDGDGATDCADSDCTSCADNDLCNGTETCVAGACAAGSPLECDDGNLCSTDSCNPATGCAHANVADGLPCNDSTLCNGTERCENGVCIAGVAEDCDDGNVCTTDSCDAVTGCGNVAVANGTACLDADVCNGAETCVDGGCAAGSPLDCDDGDLCSTDSCDAVTGCGHVAVSCPAGQNCNAATGTCEAPCVPTCAGKECGDDGCGGSCGTCADGEACDSAGKCRIPNSFTWKRKADGLKAVGVNFATPDSCPPVQSMDVSADEVTIVFTADPTGCKVDIKLEGGFFDPGCWDEPFSKPDATHLDTNGDGIADACGPIPQGTRSLFCDTEDGTVTDEPNFGGDGLDFLLSCP